LTDGVLFLKASPPTKVEWPAGVKLVGLDPTSLGFQCGGEDKYCSTAYANLYASFKDTSGRATPGIRKKYGIDGKLVFVSYSAGLGFTSPLLNNDGDRADVAGVVLMDSTFGSGYSGYQKAAKDAVAGKLALVSVTSDKGTTDSHYNGDYAFREAVLKPAGLIDMPAATAVPPMPTPGEGVFHQGALWYYRYKDSEYAHQNLGKLLAPVSEAHVVPILRGAALSSGAGDGGGISPVVVVGGLAALVGGVYAWQRMRSAS
jgi:hypothetical protein